MKGAIWDESVHSRFIWCFLPSAETKAMILRMTIKPFFFLYFHRFSSRSKNQNIKIHRRRAKRRQYATCIDDNFNTKKDIF